MTPAIGALVITRNEARDLPGCLESLAFCDERVVVDSFSDDATPEIAKRGAEHVYQRSFTTHADQKNWGMAQLATPWILIVDADERVPPGLAAELRDLATSATQDGFWIHRRTWFFGREIRGAGWRRDRVLRFLRAGAGHYPSRAVHEEIELHAGGAAGVCSERLEHYSYQDWPRTFSRLLNYSTRAAVDRAGRGEPGLAKLWLSPLGRFLRQYVVQGGFRDGLHGFVLCTFSAIGVYLRWAKLQIGDRPPSLDRGQPGAGSVQVLRGRAPTESGPSGDPDGR